MPVVMLLTFALTLFASSALLFLVQPMVGKMVLPLLGGAPAVWNTCVLFFQAVLLAGYLYAHLSTKYLGPRRQAWLHLGLMAVPLAFFAVNGPLTISPSLVEGLEARPVLALLLVLSASVAVPLFVVSTTASVLIRWFGDTDHPSARDPYFLFAASNLGSLLALAAYPLLVERILPLADQRLLWCAGFALLAALVGVCAWLMWRSEPAGPAIDPVGQDAATVSWGRRLRWGVLALVPCSLMLGATTYITTDLAPAPLLWVLPLLCYLLSFILAFAALGPTAQGLLVAAGCSALAGGAASCFLPWPWALLAAGGGLGFGLLLVARSNKEPLREASVLIMPLLVLLLVFALFAVPPEALGLGGRIGLHLVTLFVVSLVCHGELARDRPPAPRLTEFFLALSVGGALGGLFNALVAPLAFDAVVEYQLMLAAACLLVPALPTGPRAGERQYEGHSDAALAWALFLVGPGLLLLYFFGQGPPVSLSARDWRGVGLALVPALAFGGLAAWRGWWGPTHEGGNPAPEPAGVRALDVLSPVGLFLLALGLFWGLRASNLFHAVEGLAELVFRETRPGDEAERARLADALIKAVAVGVPALLCYTFAERPLRFGLGAGLLMLAAGLSASIQERAQHQRRSFFGVLKVVEDGAAPLPTRHLVHGSTVHGTQVFAPGLEGVPAAFYHPAGPLGGVMAAYNRSPDRAIAVLGLGTGAVAAYGLPGQRVDFFEIDAAVKDISFDTDEHFTYVADARRRGVEVALVLGDARLTFAPGRGDVPRLLSGGRQAAPLGGQQKYGLVLVDVFSGDAIPVHLLTREAVEVYLRRLHHDGALCVHISNLYVDLRPVLAGVISSLRERGEPGLVGYEMNDPDENAPGKRASRWVVIARDEKHLRKLWEVPEPGAAGALSLSLMTSCGGPGMQAAGGVAGACRRLAEAAEDNVARGCGRPRGWVDYGAFRLPAARTGWARLDGPDDIERRQADRLAQLEQARKRLKELAERGGPPDAARMRLEAGLWFNELAFQLAPNAARQLAEGPRLDWAPPEAELRARREYLRGVGVWTDDYSNFWSVLGK